VEAEAEVKVGTTVEAEVEDRRGENLEEHVEAKPRWRGRQRGKGRGRARGRQIQPITEEEQWKLEMDEMIQFRPEDIGMERVGTMENPADDEGSTADESWM
jgi:hypothetical protein